MAYADQSSMSTRKLVSIGLVVLLHALLGYAFMTGLAFNVVKQVAKDLKTFDVVEEPPPPEETPPPPPPPDAPPVQPPPMVAPPPIVQPPVVMAPPVQTVQVAPPPVITPTAPVAPPAPPAPPAAPAISKAAAARGNPGSWVTTDDYPPSAIRNEEQGTVGLTFEVNAQGRIENCRISSSSGSSTLDDAACRLVTRRGRYSPALDQSGNPIPGGTKTLRFTWRLPTE
ncbi:energy transducer TonB [Sphingomonas oleivorans]|uniref:Energy transducer TonB n=1 Tax=Sphingomonas oleivorans TaxID=1735121 RepID=A0A2T5G1K7_9SPHN|nr:energy transducer TonB [Sphingomonas oleivorans]PTQ13001.1 energy transducer TonB [Sphingomonas oleivorans]